MIYLVCINRSQPDSVAPMLRATESFGANRVLVIDRSPEISGAGFRHVVRNSTGEGFQAGRMRDMGREYVERIDPDYTGILFLDGDRIPQSDLLPHCQGDAMLFSCDDDRRGDLQGITDVTEACREVDSPFFTLGVYLSRNVIDSCKEDGRLFAPCFDGYWGDEDRDLGDRVVAAGFKVQASPLKVSGSWANRYSQGMDGRNYDLRIARRKSRFETETKPKEDTMDLKKLIGTVNQSFSAIEHAVTIQDTVRLATGSVAESINALVGEIERLTKENGELKTRSAELAQKCAESQDLVVKLSEGKEIQE